VGQTLQLAIDRTNWKDVTAASLCGFLLLFPLWAKLRAKFFSRYYVTLDSVIEEHGLLSRKSSEIRIRDIRNMVVEQTLVDRIVGVGTLFFSSAAGSHVEVRFIDVSRPRRVGDLVRAIQSKLGDGVLSSEEIADLSAQAGKAPPARPPPSVEPRPEPPPTKRSLSLDSAESEVHSQRGNTQTGLGAIGASGRSSAVAESSSATTADRGAETTQGSLAAEADEGETRDELYRLLAEQEEEGESDA